MPINSRAKGARGEREFANLLTYYGYPARRGQQFSGSKDSPDVVCDSLRRVHWECKLTQRLDLSGAMQQATRDAGDKMPLVASRRNGEDWLITMRVSDFLFAFAPSIKEANEGKV